MAKVFLIEQEPSVNTFLREVLTQAGYEVSIAPLAEVLPRVQHEQPDIAVFNLSLWQARSFQIVRNVLANAKPDSTQIVVWPLSGEYVRHQLAELEATSLPPQSPLAAQVQDLLRRISQALGGAEPATSPDLVAVLTDLRAAQDTAQYWLDDPSLARFVGQMGSLAMLEAAATFAADPTVLLRPSHLTLLDYSEREAEDALFTLARLGYLEPLDCDDDAEFAIAAAPNVQSMFAYFGVALRSLDFRRTVTLWLLANR